MKIVLKTTVEGLGDRGDIVEVADGHGRNYLIPQGLAMRATPGIEREAEGMRRAKSQRVTKAREEAQALVAKLASTSLVIAARASDEGKLFGSVSSADIAAAAAHAGVEIERRWIALDEPIKEVGEVSVAVSPQPDLTAEVSVTVIPDEG